MDGWMEGRQTGIAGGGQLHFEEEEEARRPTLLLLLLLVVLVLLLLLLLLVVGWLPALGPEAHCGGNKSAAYHWTPK